MSRFVLAAALLCPSIALAQSYTFEQLTIDNRDITQKIIEYQLGQLGSAGNGGTISLIAGMTVVPRARIIAVPHGDVVAIEIITPTEVWDFEVWNDGYDEGFAIDASFAYNEEAHVAWLFFMDDTDGKESISLVDTQGDWMVYDWLRSCG